MQSPGGRAFLEEEAAVQKQGLRIRLVDLRSRMRVFFISYIQYIDYICYVYYI